jgi:sugar/nucleoside kinase (ribokinase family)
MTRLPHNGLSERNGELSPVPRVAVGTGLVALDVVIGANSKNWPHLWAGGTCGNVLTILKFLGWCSFPVARVKNDTAGKIVRRDLKRLGVSVRFLGLKPHASTPVVVQRIRTRGSGIPSHSFSWACPGCGARLPGYQPVAAGVVRRTTANLPIASVCFLDRVSRGAITLAEWFREHGAVVFFEPSAAGDPNLMKEALGLAHIVKYSHERSLELSRSISNSRPLLEIETLGTDGLRYRSRLNTCRKANWQHLDPFEVQRAKDTAGAGDWCSAGIIDKLAVAGSATFGRVSADCVDAALRYGQALAAWNCRFEGARGGMYNRDKATFLQEVDQILSKRSIGSTIADRPPRRVQHILKRLCPSCGGSSAADRHAADNAKS